MKLLLPLTLFVASCAAPTVVSTSSTPQESKVSIALDTVAHAIQQTEGTAMSPTDFNNFLETYIALIPYAQPYIKDAELAYLLMYKAGQVSVPALEALAQRYYSK